MTPMPIGVRLRALAGRRASLFILFALGTSCQSAKDGAEQAETFPVIHPIRKDTVYAREYVADIQSALNIEIRAKAAGFLESIHVDEGTYVQSGQLLFTIHQKPYEQEVLKAEAVHSSAMAETKAMEVELRNTEALVQKGIISPSELELANARFEALRAKAAEAEADASAARLQLSFTQIKAPFSGFVNRIPNKIGSLIEEGALLTTLTNPEEMLVYFTVSEKEFLDFNSAPSGRPEEVELVLANGKLYPLRGRVETAESEVNRNTGSIAFRARFRNPDRILRHGSSGKIRRSQFLKNALLIPQKSTIEIQENLYVYVVSADRRLAMRRITPAYQLTDFYVVESGISQEEFIIEEGVQRVQQNMIITPDTIR